MIDPARELLLLLAHEILAAGENENVAPRLDVMRRLRQMAACALRRFNARELDS